MFGCYCDDAVTVLRCLLEQKLAEDPGALEIMGWTEERLFELKYGNEWLEELDLRKLAELLNHQYNIWVYEQGKLILPS